MLCIIYSSFHPVAYSFLLHTLYTFWFWWNLRKQLDNWYGGRAGRNTQVKVVGNQILPYFLEIFFHIAWSQSFQCRSSFSSLILESLARYRSLHTTGQRLARRLAESSRGMAVKQGYRSHLVLRSKRQKCALPLNETKGILNKTISLRPSLTLDTQVHWISIFFCLLLTEKGKGFPSYLFYPLLYATQGNKRCKF